MQSSDMDSTEIELSDAKKEVRDLALKIEEANSRSNKLQRKPKWRQQDDPETSTNNEDPRYAEVMKELEYMKLELSKLKVNMARVLKEKRHAERKSKASSSKSSTLMASMELMKVELKELREEQAIVEFARTESKTDEMQLQLVLSDVNLGNEAQSPLNSVMEELENVKRELASVKGEGFMFMTSIDVIRDELNHVRDETGRLQKAEQKRELTVQSLNSKILRAKTKLDSFTSAESKAKTVASNLALTLEQLRAEAETARKDKQTIEEEIENMKGEILKYEYETDVAEERLTEAMDELETIKLSETKALENLRNLINTTVEARDQMASSNGSMITITNFEYEYLTGKAGGAAEVADKKICAAQAWVEALKASERELLMKIEVAQREISELSIEVEAEGDVEGHGSGLKQKVVASPRRSVTRVGNRVSVKRARLQKVGSPALRSGRRSSMQRGKAIPKLVKLFSKKNNGMDEGVV